MHIHQDMELKLFGTRWNRCSPVQDRVLCRCHVNKRLLLLLATTFLLSAIFYVSDFPLKLVEPATVLYSKAVDQINSYVVFGFPYSTETQNVFLETPPKATPTVIANPVESNHIANPQNYHFIIDEPDKCDQQNPFLVLMVPVTSNDLAARKAIRTTWGNETTIQGKTVITLFLVGLTDRPDSVEAQEQLEAESRVHRDLLQSNFVDSYFNLTIKTMVILDWLATRCPQAAYAMKVDSDMYLNLENLMTVLLAPTTPKENYITGYLMLNRPVVRDKNSKWYVSEDLYPEDTYPTYLLGMGYVFSNDLPEKLIGASKDVKPFNIEDAYVGACLKRLGIEPTSPPDQAQFRGYLKQYVREDFYWIITTILFSPQQLIDIWNDVHNPA